MSGLLRHAARYRAGHRACRGARWGTLLVWLVLCPGLEARASEVRGSLSTLLLGRQDPQQGNAVASGYSASIARYC